MDLLTDLTVEGLVNRRQEPISDITYANRIKEINSIYARLFSTEDGKYVLEHLVKMNLIGSIAERGDTLLDIGVKQGNADIIKGIIQRIETSRLSL